MALEIELKVIEIQSIKSSENTDELYFEVNGKYINSSAVIKNRFPENANWKLATGQSIGPNVILFSGDIDQGINISVVLREEDSGGLLSFTDDNYGAFTLQMTSQTDAQFTPGKDTSYSGKNGNNIHIFSMKGGKAEYLIGVRLFAKIPL